jgi:hypothetical protein
MQVEQNKESFLDFCGLPPIGQKQRRPMDGAQFHRSRVGNAGGGLERVFSFWPRGAKSLPAPEINPDNSKQGICREFPAREKGSVACSKLEGRVKKKVRASGNAAVFRGRVQHL